MLRSCSTSGFGSAIRRIAVQRKALAVSNRTLFGGKGGEDQPVSEQPAAPSEGNEAQSQIKAIEEKYSLELEQAGKKYKELEDQLRRCLAETENVRKRAEKQIADSRLFGIQKFAKDLLEVADVLEKAVDASPNDSASHEVVAMHEGLVLTQTQLQKVFAANSLVRVSPLGEPFDPNLHEAVYQIPASAAPGKAADTVGSVERVGYSLNHRTLRAAQVGVVTAV